MDVKLKKEKIIPSGINPEFKRGRQEDADEYLMSLLDRVHEDLLEREWNRNK